LFQDEKLPVWVCASILDQLAHEVRNDIDLSGLPPSPPVSEGGFR